MTFYLALLVNEIRFVTVIDSYRGGQRLDLGTIVQHGIWPLVMTKVHILIFIAVRYIGRHLRRLRHPVSGILPVCFFLLLSYLRVPYLVDWRVYRVACDNHSWSTAFIDLLQVFSYHLQKLWVGKQVLGIRLGQRCKMSRHIVLVGWHGVWLSSQGFVVLNALVQLMVKLLCSVGPWVMAFADRHSWTILVADQVWHRWLFIALNWLLDPWQSISLILIKQLIALLFKLIFVMTNNFLLIEPFALQFVKSVKSPLNFKHRNSSVRIDLKHICQQFNQFWWVSWS